MYARYKNPIYCQFSQLYSVVHIFLSSTKNYASWIRQPCHDHDVRWVTRYKSEDTFPSPTRPCTIREVTSFSSTTLLIHRAIPLLAVLKVLVWSKLASRLQVKIRLGYEATESGQSTEVCISMSVDDGLTKLDWFICTLYSHYKVQVNPLMLLHFQARICDRKSLK